MVFNENTIFMRLQQIRHNSQFFRIGLKDGLKFGERRCSQATNKNTYSTIRAQINQLNECPIRTAG